MWLRVRVVSVIRGSGVSACTPPARVHTVLLTIAILAYGVTERETRRPRRSEPRRLEHQHATVSTFRSFGQLTPRYSWRDLAQGTPLWLCGLRLPRDTPCFGLQLTHKDDEGGAVKTEICCAAPRGPPVLCKLVTHHTCLPPDDLYGCGRKVGERLCGSGVVAHRGHARRISDASSALGP